MIVRLVEDLLRRVETQPVEVIFVDPVAGIGEKEGAYRSGIGAIKIYRFAPFVFVAVGEICGRERVEVVPIWAEMVVDDVQDYRDAKPVCCIDKTTKIIRP